MAIAREEVTREYLQKLWSSGSKRRAFVSELLQVYSDDWSSLLMAEINRRFEDERTIQRLRMVADTSVNLLRWAVDQIAAIYSKPANRTVEGEALPEPYENEGEIDLALDQACKMAFLCREVFVRPMLIKRGGKVLFSFDILTPNLAEVVPHPHDPLSISLLLYRVGEKKYVCWTDEFQLDLDEFFNVIEEFPNPYGEIPFVPFHAKYPARHFWHDREITPVLRANYEAGVSMTNIRYISKMQSFKQLAIKGGKLDEATSKLVGDPGQALVIPHGDVTILDWQADLTGLLNTLIEQAGFALNLYGLRPEAVRGTLSASSGYALSIEKAELERQWEILRTVFRLWDGMLYRKGAKIWSVDLGKEEFQDLPTQEDFPVGKYKIEYPEIGPGRDPKEKADLAVQLQAGGWSVENTLREIWQKDEEWIDANRAEFQAANPLMPPVDLGSEEDLIFDEPVLVEEEPGEPVEGGV